MGECYLGGVGGGKKTFAMEDCTVAGYPAQLVFPTGVKWGDIEKLSVTGYTNDAIAGFAKIDNELKYSNPVGNGAWVSAYSQPGTGDSSIFLNKSGNYFTPKYAIAILK